MMSSKSTSMALAMTLHPSRVLLWLVLLMFVLANAACGFTLYHLNLLWWWKTLLLILALGLSTLALLKFMRGRRSVYLEISDSGGIIVRQLNAQSEPGSSVTASLDVQSSYSEYVLILHLRLTSTAIMVIPVLRDSLSADDFRKLSILLRWMAAHANDEQSRILEDATGNF
ncbi:protein YgfX [Undibacterium sp.]|uniref:protein YgfX n=1 Tax=Undibacterium sp. TaxID=1914977 RepID=UPI0025CD28C9|nr:protein YgfX [Undibacterium sp.]